MSDLKSQLITKNAPDKHKQNMIRHNILTQEPQWPCPLFTNS